MKILTRFFEVAVILMGVFILSAGLQHCDKLNPHEPHVDVPPDTVVVVDTVHFHHDHEIIFTDTLFFICDTVDVSVKFLVFGDQSAPNIYWVSLNRIFVDQLVVTETFSELTVVSFDYEFKEIVFGDEIAIFAISGSRAEVVGILIVDIKCSGG